ncbi:MAG: VWA domain-containing protein [Candidatus Obscuribacter sp.]|nr:VWA domain-containing protein [Candidatus Obscuribacter sp.]
MIDDRTAELRWKLILGTGLRRDAGGTSATGFQANQQDEEGKQWEQRDKLLSFLYDREYAKSRNTRSTDSRGDLSDSVISVPDWINSVQELFPQATCERLESDALERYQIDGFVSNADILARATPSESLLRSIMRTKHLMNQEVLNVARILIRKVVATLMEKLARPVSQPFTGAKDRRRRSFLKINQNFDARTTIRKNLKNFHKESKRLVIEQPYFFSRLRQHIDKWKIIILVDQSGSMIDSVIHSAVTASIFHQLPFIKTHLIAFDTNIVDLTSESIDPVETLMKVQLGGGTDIGNAVNYASQLLEQPERTIVILISDFFEGADEQLLLLHCRRLLENRVKLICLAALDSKANPNYNRALALKLQSMGAHVGAMTPGELAAWVAEKVNLK